MAANLVPMCGPNGCAWSSDRTRRYLLARTWADLLGAPLEPRYVNFVMLNPSTADETTNDPTVERCERRARAMGYDGLLVTNLFAWRSTDPWALYHRDERGEGIGGDDDSANDFAIMHAARLSALVICAWGTHGTLQDRGDRVAWMLRTGGYAPHALAINSDGTPRHPLYVRYDVAPVPWP